MNKIFILGFDALDPNRVDRLMVSGRLPNMAKLKDMGGYRRLSTTNPAQSPVAWSAFATGMNPGKSGVCDFIIRDPSTYGLRLATSDIRGLKPRSVKKSPSFWEYASRKGVCSVILGCPVTFPPDNIKGRMLSGMGVPDILGTEGTFTYYTTALVSGKDTGGRIFHIERSSEMRFDLIGPIKPSMAGKPTEAKIPFTVKVDGPDSVEVALQGRTVKLNKGQWSGWQEAVFQAGVFLKIRGIFKLYLAEAEPDLKLFVTPISFDPRAPFFQISHPSSYSAELASGTGLFRTHGMPFDTWAVNEGRLDDGAFLAQADEIFEETRSRLEFELSRFKEGILFAYFEDADIIQHMFTRFEDQLSPLYEMKAASRYKAAIDNIYEKLDAVLGRCMTDVRDGDTLIVLSDHGSRPFRRAVHVNSWLRDNGYQVLKEGCREGGDLLADVDWDKTKAYSISFGSIYLNIKGREGRGVVGPDESGKLTDRIMSGLRGWTDKKTGDKVFGNVYKGSDIFWGPFARSAPDIVMGFNSGYRASWQTALGAAPAELIEDNMKKWSGDHLVDPPLVPGVLFANRKIKKEAPTIYDIAPTLLKAIGCTKDEILAAAMDGTDIF